jgi:hypothetical protein
MFNPAGTPSAILILFSFLITTTASALPVHDLNNKISVHSILGCKDPETYALFSEEDPKKDPTSIDICPLASFVFTTTNSHVDKDGCINVYSSIGFIKICFAENIEPEDYSLFSEKVSDNRMIFVLADSYMNKNGCIKAYSHAGFVTICPEEDINPKL